MPNIQVTCKSNMVAKMVAFLGAEDNGFLYENSNIIFFLLNESHIWGIYVYGFNHSHPSKAIQMIFKFIGHP